MTIGEYVTDDADDYSGDVSPWPAEPLQVLNVGERAAPDYGATTTWNVPQSNVGTNQPVQILQRRIKRSKARLTLTVLPTITTVNNLAAPAVPASGVAQYNNFGIPVTVTVTGGTVTAIAVNGTTTGLTSGAILVPAYGTITLTYSVAPTWTWTSTTTTTGTVILSSKLDPLQGANPQGAVYVATGNLPTWESQQPCYAIATGGAATISVIDEAYAER